MDTGTGHAKSNILKKKLPGPQLVAPGSYYQSCDMNESLFGCSLMQMQPYADASLWEMQTHVAPYQDWACTAVIAAV